jgi:hypothetical protein
MINKYLKTFLSSIIALTIGNLLVEYLLEGTIEQLINYKFITLLLIGSFICSIIIHKIEKKPNLH